MGKIVYLESIEEYAARLGAEQPHIAKDYNFSIWTFIIGLVFLFGTFFYESCKKSTTESERTVYVQDSKTSYKQ